MYSKEMYCLPFLIYVKIFAQFAIKKAVAHFCMLLPIFINQPSYIYSLLSYIFYTQDTPQSLYKNTFYMALFHY